jgi:Zn-dependent peptidase ImmA (M78 family)
LRHGEYYEELKILAKSVRKKYEITTRSIGLSTIRGIYKDEGIKLDYWRQGKFKRVRAAYMILDGVPRVVVNGQIKPKEPRIFCLCHELKHHYRDQDIINGKGYIGCQDISWSQGSPLEIGAEIFAAELIYPEAEFLDFAKSMGITEGNCTKEQVVQLKRECGAPVSYVFLRKRLEWFEFVEKGTFDGVRFQKLEEQIYGIPFYKRIKRKNARNTQPSD